MKRNEIAKILSECRDQDFIYIDCFDTLIGRKHGYEYPFFCAADFLVQECFVSADLYPLSRAISRFFDSVSSFENVASQIYYHFQISCIDTNLFCQRLRAIILKAELENTFLLPGALECLMELSALKKKIFVLTDFYLSSRDVALILHHLVGEGFAFEVFSSCDYGKTKRDGSLYSLVDSPSNSLMIGDDAYADVLVPKAMGIESLQIDSTKQKKRTRILDARRCRLENDTLNSLIGRRISTYASNMHFLIFDFCKRLFSVLHPGDTVYFCAREGQFLKKAFDLYADSHRSKNLSTVYLPVSRLALALPTTRLDNNEDIKSLFDVMLDHEALSWQTLLMRIGFDAKESNDLSQIGHFNLNDRADINVFGQLWNEQAAKTMISSKQTESIAKFGSFFDWKEKKRLVLVDVGWHGSIQDAIRKLVPNEIEMFGYYVSLTGTKNEGKNNHKIGLIDDLNRCADFRLFRRNIDFLESLLRADHGIVAAYRAGDDLYLDDAGLNTFFSYSRARQSIMLSSIRKLVCKDLSLPISKASLRDAELKVFRKWPLFTHVLDWRADTAQYLLSGKKISIRESLVVLKDALSCKMHSYMQDNRKNF